MKILKNKKHNWLVFASLILLFSFIVLAIIFRNSNELHKSSRMDIFNVNAYLLLILPITIVPVYEEIAFRGIFSKKRWIQITGTILLPVISYLYTDFSILIIAFLACYYIILVIYLSNKNRTAFIFLILCSSLLFTIGHYRLSDFKSLQLAYLSLNHLATSLFLTWVVINYSIIKSIIVHALLNLLSVIPLFLLFLSYNESEPVKKTKEGLMLEYKLISPLSKTQANTHIGSSSLEINGSTLLNYCKIMNNLFLKEDSIKIYPKDPVCKYQLSILPIQENDTSDFKFRSIQFLEDEDLIIIH